MMNSMALRWTQPSGRYILPPLLSSHSHIPHNHELPPSFELALISIQARYKEGNYGEGELEYYIPEQVSVYGGYLVINSTNMTYIVCILSFSFLFFNYFLYIFICILISLPLLSLQDKNYVSAWVDSKDKFYLTYGRYEFRAKMAGTYGTSTPPHNLRYL
jgi:hypothetical protein